MRGKNIEEMFYLVKGKIVLYHVRPVGQTRSL